MTLAEHVRRILKGSQRKMITRDELRDIKGVVDKLTQGIVNFANRYEMNAVDLYFYGLVDGIEAARRWSSEELNGEIVMMEVDEILKRFGNSNRDDETGGDNGDGARV